ncbi:hypothetical protein C8J57DRAFT_1622090 [Mycena rebaudengoi]|nr:hypothetical protein C8J57DRAFT_1622090 [Mycena rebaudengoi]
MTIPPVVGRHLLLAPSLGLKHTLFDPRTWHSSNVAVCLSMSQALQVSRPYPLLKLLLDPHTLVKVKPAINSQVQVIVKVLLALRTHPSGVRLAFTAQGPHALSAAVSAIGRVPTLSRLPSRSPPTRRMPPVPNRRRFAPLPHARSRDGWDPFLPVEKTAATVALRLHGSLLFSAYHSQNHPRLIPDALLRAILDIELICTPAYALNLLWKMIYLAHQSYSSSQADPPCSLRME